MKWSSNKRPKERDSMSSPKSLTGRTWLRRKMTEHPRPVVTMRLSKLLHLYQADVLGVDHSNLCIRTLLIMREKANAFSIATQKVMKEASTSDSTENHFLFMCVYIIVVIVSIYCHQNPFSLFPLYYIIWIFIMCLLHSDSQI